MRSKWIPLTIFVVAATYLSILAVKSFSWTLISSDSGGWLAAATQWQVPQPYGAPPYVLLGRFLSLFHWNLPALMSVFLSAIPSALSVMFVYLILKRLTKSTSIGIISSAVLLGSAVFLSQATITGYHAFSAMWVTLAFWAYIQDKPKLTMVFLGVGTAFHVMIAFIALFWLLGDIAYGWKDKRYKIWFYKPILIYIACGILPYGMIPILMAFDTPHFLAGGLSLESIIGYWSTTSRAIMGTISVFEFPARVLNTSKIVLMSFGLALIPFTVYLVSFFKDKTKSRYSIPLIGTILYVMWYVLTCLDAQTWTYIVFASSSMVILVGLGLARLKDWHRYTVVASAGLLIIFNAVFLNANVLTNENPKGTTYLAELNALPDNAIVLTEPGPYSMGMFYAINSGKNIIPLVYPYLDDPTFGRGDYPEYIHDRWGVQWTSTPQDVKEFQEQMQLEYGNDTLNWVDVPTAVNKYHMYLWERYRWSESGTLKAISDALASGREVYAATEWYSVINQCFARDGEGLVRRITALSGLEPAPYKKAAKGTQGTDPFTR
jgi:hypothetical protein